MAAGGIKEISRGEGRVMIFERRKIPEEYLGVVGAMLAGQGSFDCALPFASESQSSAKDDRGGYETCVVR